MTAYGVAVARAGVPAAFTMALMLAACGAPPPPAPPIALPEPGAGAPPVVGSPVTAPAMPEPPAAARSAASASPAPPAGEPPVAIPAGAVYACLIESPGARQVTAIELAPKVAALCAQNPEMSPCQYEREVCRAGGGRVFAADGKEITKATEVEYDRRVLRVRINSN